MTSRHTYNIEAHQMGAQRGRLDYERKTAPNDPTGWKLPRAQAVSLMHSFGMDSDALDTLTGKQMVQEYECGYRDAVEDELYWNALYEQL